MGSGGVSVYHQNDVRRGGFFSPSLRKCSAAAFEIEPNCEHRQVEFQGGSLQLLSEFYLSA
jgi:hypothetical protein